MYHPTRGGVRGGRDQFSWDDVKVDKHRENYLGHSIKAPVGRWQKGKDLHWYARDKKSSADMEAAKEEIRLIKEREEEAMREALGLAPKRARQLQGNRLDKHEFSELVKRGSTAEDLGGGHAEAAKVHGLGYARAHRAWEEPISLQPAAPKISDPEAEKVAMPNPSARTTEVEEEDDERKHKKRRHEEKRRDRHEKRHARGYEDEKKHKSDKGRKRHDSD